MRKGIFERKKNLVFFMVVSICIIIILWTVVGVLGYYTQRSELCRLDFSSSKPGSNIGDAIQGDYVLFSKLNRIEDFPFVIGGKLVLYDVAHDKEWTVSHTIVPWGREGDRLLFHNSDVYTGTTGNAFSDALDLKYVSLRNGAERLIKCVGDLPDAYSVHDGTLYYVDGTMDEDEKSCIYAVDPSEDKRKLIIEDYIGSMAIYEDTLFWSNPRTKEVNLCNLRTGNTSKCADIYNDATVIQQIDKDRFAVFYESGKVNIFQNGQVRKLCDVSTSFFWGETVTCHDRHLYFYNEDERKVCSIDIATGNVETFYDLENEDRLQIREKKRESPAVNVSFSDQYIVLVVDRWKDTEKIVVLDYTGKVLTIRDA